MLIESDNAPFPNLGEDHFIKGLDVLCLETADFLVRDRQGIDGSQEHPSAIAPGTDLAGDANSSRTEDGNALFRTGGVRDRTVRRLQAFLATGGEQGRAWLSAPQEFSEFLRTVNLDPEKVQKLSLMLLRLRGRSQLRTAKGGALYDKELAGLLYPVLSEKDWVSKVLQEAIFAYGDVAEKDLDLLFSKRGLSNDARNCLVLRILIEVLKLLWIPILELDDAVDLLEIHEHTFDAAPPLALDSFPGTGLNWADPDQRVVPKMVPRRPQAVAARLLEGPLPECPEDEGAAGFGPEPDRASASTGGENFRLEEVPWDRPGPPRLATPPLARRPTRAGVSEDLPVRTSRPPNSLDCTDLADRVQREVAKAMAPLERKILDAISAALPQRGGVSQPLSPPPDRAPVEGYHSGEYARSSPVCSSPHSRVSVRALLTGAASHEPYQDVDDDATWCSPSASDSSVRGRISLDTARRTLIEAFGGGPKGTAEAWSISQWRRILARGDPDRGTSGTFVWVDLIGHIWAWSLEPRKGLRTYLLGNYFEEGEPGDLDLSVAVEHPMPRSIAQFRCLLDDLRSALAASSAECLTLLALGPDEEEELLIRRKMARNAQQRERLEFFAANISSDIAQLEANGLTEDYHMSCFASIWHAWVVNCAQSVITDSSQLQSPICWRDSVIRLGYLPLLTGGRHLLQDGNLAGDCVVSFLAQECPRHHIGGNEVFCVECITAVSRQGAGYGESPLLLRATQEVLTFHFTHDERKRAGARNLALSATEGFQLFAQRFPRHVLSLGRPSRGGYAMAYRTHQRFLEEPEPHHLARGGEPYKGWNSFPSSPPITIPPQTTPASGGGPLAGGGAAPPKSRNGKVARQQLPFVVVNQSEQGTGIVSGRE